MASEATPGDLDRILTEQGFKAYAKALARHHGESEARAAFAYRTATEREAPIIVLDQGGQSRPAPMSCCVPTRSTSRASLWNWP